jgi:PTS system ascorbate-specific IIA component
MSVGILIVTHGSTAESLVEEAAFVLGQKLERVFAMEFMHSTNPTRIEDILSGVRQADDGDGVLVLTDLMGASPANMVAEALEQRNAVMVTGVNLAMLIRAFNYRDQALELVVQKAVDGGKSAVKIFQS